MIIANIALGLINILLNFQFLSLLVRQFHL